MNFVSILTILHFSSITNFGMVWDIPKLDDTRQKFKRRETHDLVCDETSGEREPLKLSPSLNGMERVNLADTLSEPFLK